jgi:hypothetical protein
MDRVDEWRASAGARAGAELGRCARRVRQSWSGASAAWQRPRLRGCRAGRARKGVIRKSSAQQAAPVPTVRSVPVSVHASAGSCKNCDPAVLPHPGHRAAGLVEGIRAVSRPGPSTAPARVEQLPRHRLSRASAAQREVSKPARSPRRPTRVGPRPKTAFPTTGAPPSHRIPGPQADARGPTEGNSEDSAPWHMASFRRQSSRTP